jgi:hypothetical protein
MVIPFMKRAMLRVFLSPNRRQRTQSEDCLVVKANVVRCPYCVDGDNFKILTARSGGKWFLCSECGHLVMPQNPAYICKCARCVELLQINV